MTIIYILQDLESSLETVVESEHDPGVAAYLCLRELQRARAFVALCTLRGGNGRMRQTNITGARASTRC